MSAAPVVLITGAARRIGAGMARFFHTRGCHVVIHYRQSAAQAEALCAELCALRPQSALAVAADLANAEGCSAVVAAALSWQGRLDGLVNNASTFIRSDLGQVDEAHWTYLIDGNLKAAFFCSQYAAPALRASGGAIVNVCDVRTDRPLPGFSVYTAAKAGIVSLTRSLALELAPQVRVNAISPGSLTWPEDDTFDASERARIEARPRACAAPRRRGWRKRRAVGRPRACAQAYAAPQVPRRCGARATGGGVRVRRALSFAP